MVRQYQRSWRKDRQDCRIFPSSGETLHLSELDKLWVERISECKNTEEYSSSESGMQYDKAWPWEKPQF